MRRRLALLALTVALLGAPAAPAASPPAATGPEPAVRAAATTTVPALRYELRRFTRWRTERVGDVGAEEPPDAISGDLLLAIGSRETNLRNIVGGGFFDPAGSFVVTGADRGVFQINEAFHRGFLESVPGCVSGSFSETLDSAYPRGRVPGLTRAARYAVLLLRDRVAYATANGVPPEDAVRVAVAAYNAGAFNAVRGYREGNPDRFTTGGDYSRDVLDRRAKIRRARRDLGWASVP